MRPPSGVTARRRGGPRPDAAGRRARAGRAPGGRYSGAVTRPTPRAPQLVVRRSTSVLTAGLAVAGALALSGCQLTSPQQTTVPYQPADGVDVTLGAVKVERPRAHRERQGPAGRPLGADHQQRRPGGNRHHRRAGRRAAVTKQVAAGSMTRLSGESPGSPATLPTVSVEPGSLMNLTIGTSAAGSNVVGVPVLRARACTTRRSPPPRRRPVASARPHARPPARRRASRPRPPLPAAEPPRVPPARPGCAGGVRAGSGGLELVAQPAHGDDVRGLAGSGSILARSRLTCTSRVLVSPT